MGITLYSDTKLESDVVCDRISSASSVVFASRGIGSYDAPVPPTILSKIYWTIAVPRMEYGLEVTPITDKSVEELEASHRKMCKVIQGLPGNTPLPAPLASLGWMSMKSHIAMRKILFLIQLLSLPDNNVYKRIVLHILGNVGPYCPDVSKSPIKEMYRAAWRYGMGIDVWKTLVFGSNISLSAQKIEIKKEMWKIENINWRATCHMYRNLISYCSLLQHIHILSWWKFAQRNPHKLKQVSATVALLLGTQPKGLQHNFGQKPCMLCDQYSTESTLHILFECREFHRLRCDGFQTISIKMPDAMQNEYNEMSIQARCTFLLSGLNDSYVPEWDALYAAIAQFVWDMYRCRDAKYKALVIND